MPFIHQILKILVFECHLVGILGPNFGQFLIHIRKSQLYPSPFLYSGILGKIYLMCLFEPWVIPFLKCINRPFQLLIYGSNIMYNWATMTVFLWDYLGGATGSMHLVHQDHIGYLDFLKSHSFYLRIIRDKCVIKLHNISFME